MPNILTRLVLFLSSYSPLFVLLVIRNNNASHYVAVGLLVLAGGSFLVLAAFLWRVQHFESHEVAVSTVEPRGTETMGYIMTYLIPFLDIDLAKTPDIISLGLLLAVLGLLYTNSNLIHVNPMLAFFGYKIFDTTVDQGKPSALVTRKAYVRSGTKLNVISMGDYVLIEKKS